MHSYGEVIKLVSPKVNCLNPCFNGRCTRTYKFLKNLGYAEDSLNPCFNGRCTRTFTNCQMSVHFKVLILVLMEDALVL